jgi:hypothetical protein
MVREAVSVPWSRLPTSDAGGEGAQPIALSSLLDTVLNGLGAPKADAIVAINEAWGTIVGDELAVHAHPISIEAGRLRVGVDSPAWASHLQWSEREILARIERLVGPAVVSQVTTRIVRR